MKKGQYNILAKSDKQYAFIITDFIATKLNKTDFEELKKLNPKLLGDYHFIPYKETDFSWWSKISKYLTKNKLYYNACFDADWYGNVMKF